VLLTITTTRAPATDLGYLLHKHPDRVQAFATAADTAHVFYPEATPQRCTAALLLEVDPVALVRGPIGKNAPNTDGELAQYVNDRPYAASSMLAVALKGAFRTALTGRCDARPDLAAERIPLSIRVPALRCRGGSELATQVFEPLGWTVQTTTQDLQPPDGDRPGPAGEAVRGAERRPSRPRAPPGPRVGPGPRVLPVRADHRRDRRVRPAGQVPVGPGVPRPRPGAVRPHPGARDRVGEQHHVPGYRVCLRRPSDGFQLSRTDRGVSPGGTCLLRPGQAVPGRTALRTPAGAPRAGRPGHPGRLRVAGAPDGVPAADGSARGSRRGRAGGDEPVRHRPPLAAVPAADDEPSRRGSGSSWHRHRAAARICSSTPSRPSRRPSRPGCSTSSAPPGCCWTPNCCPGALRPASSCVTSTPPWAPRPRCRCPPRMRLRRPGPGVRARRPPPVRRDTSQQRCQTSSSCGVLGRPTGRARAARTGSATLRWPARPGSRPPSGTRFPGRAGCRRRPAGPGPAPWPARSS
jgi:RNA repair, ligase-Pnkp-associating, region of Hen1